MTLDLSKKEDVLRFCELRRREYSALFLRHGQLSFNGFSFGAYVFMTHAAPVEAWGESLDEMKVVRGPKLERPVATLVMLPDYMWLYDFSTVKDSFRRVVEKLANIGQAVGTLLISESWLALTDDDRTAPSQRPDRLEALSMQLEHQTAGTQVWNAVIHRDPLRLGPWSTLQEMLGVPNEVRSSVTGRMTFGVNAKKSV